MNGKTICYEYKIDKNYYYQFLKGVKAELKNEKPQKWYDSWLNGTFQCVKLLLPINNLLFLNFFFL